MSGSPSVVLSPKGTLTITGTDASDTITVTARKRYYVVDITGDRAFRSFTARTALKDVARIAIYGLDGDDRITVAADVHEAGLLDAGVGADRVDAFNVGRLTINGGAGADKLRHLAYGEITVATTTNGNAFAQSTASSELIGGGGDDTLSTNVPGDTLNGGAGDDDRLVTVDMLGSSVDALIVSSRVPDFGTPPDGTVVFDIIGSRQVYTIDNERIEHSTLLPTNSIFIGGKYNAGTLGGTLP